MTTTLNFSEDLLQKNLKHVGAEDPIVTVETLAPGQSRFTFHPKKMMVAAEVSLSWAYAQYHPIWVTGKGGKYMGYTDSDGALHYTGAPNVLACLQWAVATDWGRDHELSLTREDLEADALQLLYFVQQEWHQEGDEPMVPNPEMEKTRFHRWMDCLKSVTRVNEFTRFADGYCIWCNTFWEVATREVLGKSMEPFSSMF